MSLIRVAIAVSDDALGQVDEVIRACRALGFRSDTTLTGVGVFTGVIRADCVSALRSVPGIAAVEPQRGVWIHASHKDST
jgi:hypothetical protein